MLKPNERKLLEHVKAAEESESTGLSWKAMNNAEKRVAPRLTGRGFLHSISMRPGHFELLLTEAGAKALSEQA